MHHQHKAFSGLIILLNPTWHQQAVEMDLHGSHLDINLKGRE